MVTLIDDDQAISGGELGDIVTSGQALDHDHVHYSLRLAPTPTQLTDLLCI